ncbi:relaxase/mobilization nuclease domain-containing protein [uncultured Sneathiella sp.]|uniref:relaxase/mobilization nuclease domain-containing protein n=1 Tax=uncultured Sneathiella sp. TaxID=879315 RepID=UPI0030ECDE5A|tara:strand:+ start:421 stop:1845 length:1425 start_codon:yes stop_codon:yes gene_type:complete
MILKGSQRGGAKQLGAHLLKTEENEHVELHDIRGFVSDDVIGALREAEAVAKGTKCRQYLFSVSLNPPQTENVRIETFEQAIRSIEERNGLTGQPRVIIFHEKEGRRHAHAVWSRIDAETMTAKSLSFYKNKLQEVSRQLYLDNGWKMPRGLVSAKERDPRNFSLAEWQQANRIGQHAGELKEHIQEAWAISDSKTTFSHALEERGLYLARGDRRGHVAMTFEGEVISIARATGRKYKDLQARLGKPETLPSTAETRKRIAQDILPRMKSHLKEARDKAKEEFQTLEARRLEMVKAHAQERAKLDAGQKARFETEAKLRAERFRKGMKGLWDRMTGKRAQLEKQNQLEAMWAFRRDQDQRQMTINAQMRERRALQADIKAARSKHAQALRELYFDAANYRLMKRGEAPKAKSAYERLDTMRRENQRPQARPRFDQLKEVKPQPKKRPLSAQERLQKLRDQKRSGPSHDSPDLER